MTNSKRKPYRVVAVSLYDEEAREADRLTDILQRAGWHRASRSLVIREAVARLREELTGKSAEEVFRYFMNRYARRAATSRITQPASSDHDAANRQH